MDPKRCRENLNLKSAILSGITQASSVRIVCAFKCTSPLTALKQLAAWALKLGKVVRYWQADAGDKAKVKCSTSSKHF
jgi:hypothetical protein